MGFEDNDDFPTIPDMQGAVKGATWTHPSTKTVYFWDPIKNSWGLYNNVGAKMYTGIDDPSASGRNRLLDGDMWWDSEHLELRVYHKPTHPDPNTFTTGVWVSSTNPEMTPEDLDRNLIIGTVTASGPRDPIVDTEVMYEVTRNGGAPDEKIEFEWVVAPDEVPQVGADPIKLEFNFGDQNKATIVWPPESYLMDGEDQQIYKVYCRVKAKEEHEDAFVSKEQLSNVINVRPLPQTAQPLESVGASLGTNTSGDPYIYFSDRSKTVSNGEVESTGMKPNFFVVPGALLGDRDNYELEFSKKPYATHGPNDLLGSYQENYEFVLDSNNSPEKATGYVVQISNLNTLNPLPIYVWDTKTADPVTGIPTIEGVLTLVP